MIPDTLPRDEFLSRPVLELVELLRRREVSSEELVRRSLDRIQAYNPRIQAFVSVFDRAARRAAERIDLDTRRGDPSGRPYFLGVPTAVKDLNLLRGSFARMGSAAFRYLWSPVDDVTVADLRRAGFVFVGKTATSELAIMPVTEPDTHPPTRNPWDEGRTSGGSSGGSGAAVAASFVPVAQASDGAGSIRIPASFCGLVGHKSSAGLLPNPHARFDPLGMSTNGALTRTVEDTAAMLDVLLRRSPEAPDSFLAQCRRVPGRQSIRLVLAPPLGECAPEVVAAIEVAAKRLEDLGHEVTLLGPAEGTLDEFLPIYKRMVAATPFIRDQDLQPITRWLRNEGKRLVPEDARRARDALAKRANDWWGDADLVFSPTVPVLPPRVGAFSGLPPEEGFAKAAVLGAFTALCNVSGRPAISIPVGTASGVPIGGQIIGRAGADATVLAVARQLEAALGGNHR